ncbi:MAG TPA: hypothetical protein VFQ27_13295 [Xanthobacteraceae bacterium]|nr:hypothetical protein [Xanthobacteraceae bacterium]
MVAQLDAWKAAAERLWSAAELDCRAAAQLAAAIAREAEDETLRQKGAHALPSLRAACAPRADQQAKALARRRFAPLRDALHALTGPRFGKRDTSSSGNDPEAYYRRLLGLPLGGHLRGADIQQAYKRAAKLMHPDGGGSEHAFRELAAARDALMKSQRA